MNWRSMMNSCDYHVVAENIGYGVYQYRIEKGDKLAITNALSDKAYIVSSHVMKSEALNKKIKLES